MGPTLRLLAVLLGTALLAGCAITKPPDRAEIQEQALKDIPLPGAWKAGSDSGGVADNWLAAFSDPQLNELVAEALARNLDLKVASTRVEQAAQYVEQAKAALRPQVNVLGSGGTKMGSGDPLQFLSLGASWELDLWGRLRYGRNAAQESAVSVLADYEFARQSLAATTAKSWFTASETWLQLQIAEGMVQSSKQLLTVAEKRMQVGPGSDQDVALARAALGNYQDNARKIRFAHEQSIRALELLLGRYPAAELKARRDLAKLPGPVPAGIPLEILERRPDIIAAERRVAAAFNRVGEAKAAKLPRINLSANIASVSSEILQLRQDYENPSIGAGATLVAPIYQGGALETQVRIRTIEQKEAVANYARTALRALGDVENALAAGMTLAEREQILQRVVSDHQRAFELAKTSYSVGRTDQRAVQQQQLNVYAASLTLLGVQSEQLAQRVNLHLALGGNFAERPKPQDSEKDPQLVSMKAPTVQQAESPESQPNKTRE